MQQDDDIIESPPWSDLHTSLLDQIAGNLCYGDQVLFHGVCKSWNAAQYKTRLADLLPWVLRVSRPSLDMFQCDLYAIPSLFNPYMGEFKPKPIVVENIYLDQFVSSYPSCLDTDIDITCNYGWILFSIPTRDYTATTFLFYSPLTKGVVVLPQLTHSRGTNCNCKLTTCFSAEPSSPDFVLLVVRHSEIDTVNTYCHGQGKWNAKKFDNVFSLADLCPDSVVVYVRGLFCFVDTFGWVTSYNITSGTWKWECDTDTFDMTIYTSYMRYAFESNGELMIVYCSENSKYGVSRFDWSGKCWLPLNNLSDQTLFVGANSFCYNLVLPNKIHILRRDSRHNAYDLKDGKAFEVFMNNPACGSRGSGLQVYSESTFWFEPPGLIACDQETIRLSEEVLFNKGLVWSSAIYNVKGFKGSKSMAQLSQ